MRGFDELWGLGLIFQCFANFSNADFEDGVTDSNIGPERFQQFLFGHQPTGPLDKITQH